LLRRQFPIALFDGLGQPREFQVRVGIARGVQKVLKPRAAGNAVRVEPFGFDLEKLIVEALDFLRRDIACEEIACSGLAQKVARLLEIRDPRMQPFQIDVRLQIIFLFVIA
jgi:hypothetical protein